MLTAVATRDAATGEVTVLVGAALPGVEEGAEEETDSPIIPIAPEWKEMAWGFGSFVVLALLMRFVLYPRLRKGMDARYQKIRGGHDDAERITDAAQSDVAEYEQQLQRARDEARQRIDRARETLDTERAERLQEVNARIADKRASAATEVEAARAAAQADVEAAVRVVANRAGELALGRAPDRLVVAAVVDDVMSTGVTR